MLEHISRSVVGVSNRLDSLNGTNQDILRIQKDALSFEKQKHKEQKDNDSPDSISRYEDAVVSSELNKIISNRATCDKALGYLPNKSNFFIKDWYTTTDSFQDVVVFLKHDGNESKVIIDPFSLTDILDEINLGNDYIDRVSVTASIYLHGKILKELSQSVIIIESDDSLDFDVNNLF